jgi:hypothetical protein
MPFRVRSLICSLSQGDFPQAQRGGNRATGAVGPPYSRKARGSRFEERFFEENLAISPTLFGIPPTVETVAFAEKRRRGREVPGAGLPRCAQRGEIPWGLVPGLNSLRSGGTGAWEKGSAAPASPREGRQSIRIPNDTHCLLLSNPAPCNTQSLERRVRFRVPSMRLFPSLLSSHTPSHWWRPHLALRHRHSPNTTPQPRPAPTTRSIVEAFQLPMTGPTFSATQGQVFDFTVELPEPQDPQIGSPLRPVSPES